MALAEASSSSTPVVLVPSLNSSSLPSLTSPWQPSRYTQPPAPPPPDERAERAFAAELEFRRAQGDEERFASRGRGGANGEPPKKLKARRTVDYFGEWTKWKKVRRSRPQSAYTPYLRPQAEFLIDLLPPPAYLTNPSYSICDVFIHSSVNKIRSAVNVVKWTPEARRILTGSLSGEFTLWNGQSFNFETILQAHDSPIRAIEYSHSGHYILSSDDQGQIKYYLPNMNNLTVLRGHEGHSCRSLSFSPSDTHFGSCGDDGSIRIWDFNTRTQISGWRGHGQDVRCLDWHQSKGLLVSGSSDDRVNFWDPRSKVALGGYLHKNSVMCAKWNPGGDGNLVATGSRDTSVRVYDIRTFKELVNFKGHKKDVLALAWNPIHRDLLATGDSTGSIIQWTLDSPNPRSVIEYAHDQQVFDLDWHPLGHILASGSNDHTTRFWERGRVASQEEIEFGGTAPGIGGSASVSKKDVFHLGTEKMSQLGMNTKMSYQQDDLDDFDAPGFNQLPGLNNERQDFRQSSFNPSSSLPGFRSQHNEGTPPVSSVPPAQQQNFQPSWSDQTPGRSNNNTSWSQSKNEYDNNANSGYRGGSGRYDGGGGRGRGRGRGRGNYGAGGGY